MIVISGPVSIIPVTSTNPILTVPLWGLSSSATWVAGVKVEVVAEIQGNKILVTLPWWIILRLTTAMYNVSFLQNFFFFALKPLYRTISGQMNGTITDKIFWWLLVGLTSSFSISALTRFQSITSSWVLSRYYLPTPLILLSLFQLCQSPLFIFGG